MDRRPNKRLSVVLRIRPMMPHENTKGSKVAYTENEKVVVLIDPSVVDSSDVLRAKRTVERRYEFDWALDKDCTQENVYDKTTRSLVDDVLKGFNGTIFAYGATGSGKTYTMAGTNDEPGIMIRALSHIFHVAEKRHFDTDFQMSLSYAEIYNDNIRDLLNPTSGYLELREDAKGNHTVVGLAEVGISSSSEVVRLLNKANRQRMQEPTSANRTSSRSHAMLQVTIRQSGKRKGDHHYHRDEEKASPTERYDVGTYEVKTGRLYMVDLAGSERASQTQNTGKRLVEGAHINKSLLALGNCINALADRSAKYVNFRDSKLTRLLKVPLSGNCKTVMISHISPAAHHYEETRKTLLYASRAKNINNKTYRILKNEEDRVKNNVSNVTHHVAQYQNIISELKMEINRLQDKIEVQDRESRLAEIENQKFPIDENKVFEKRLGNSEMKRLKTELMSCFNTQMELRRKLMDAENALVAIDCEFERLGFMVNEWEAEVTRKGNSKNPEAPQYIQQAWEEVRFLENEEKRYLKERGEIQKNLEDSRQKAHAVMESLPSKASSDEQRELLSLLTRVHRLEIENMEMQASQLIREQELRQREVMILRYDRQRQLCDEIITKQRMLIDNIQTGKKVASKFFKLPFRESKASSTTPVSPPIGVNPGEMAHELSELYRLYQQEMQEIVNGRDSVIKYLNTASSQNNGSLAPRPLGSSGSLLDLSGTKSTSPLFKLPSIKRDVSASKIEDSGNGRSLGVKNDNEVSVSEPATPIERSRTRTLPKVPEDRKRKDRKHLAVDRNVTKGAVGCCRGPTFISLEDKQKTNDTNNNEVKTEPIKDTLPKLQHYAERRRKKLGVIPDRVDSI